MATSEEISPMLTTGEVARLLNIHINTVRRWSNEGILKAYRIGSRGDRRFRRQEIATFLSRKRKTA
jgi:excisionase family DNA binding protein